MNYPSYLFWVEPDLPQVDCVSAEGTRDARKASDVQQKPETGHEKVWVEIRGAYIGCFAKTLPKSKFHFQDGRSSRFES